MKSKKKKTILELWDKIFPELLISLLVIAFYLLSVDLYQYLFTEVWWKFDSLNYNYTTLYLILLIIAFSFINLKKILDQKYIWQGFIVLFFVGTLIAHKYYTDFYTDLQTYPKIKSISKDWGIPGSWVKVEGKNFGGEWEPGKVYLGDTEMIIKKWSDKEIVFEIPVSIKEGNQGLGIENIKKKKQKEHFQIHTMFDLKNAGAVLK